MTANQTPAIENTGIVLENVACDDGFAYTKVAYFEDGIIKTFSIPSRGRSGASLETSSGEPIDAYHVDGHTYTVSDRLSAYDTTEFDDYPHSPLNRAIIQHALLKAGVPVARVKLGVTLPFARFFANPAVANDQRKVSLVKPVKSLSSDRSIQVGDVKTFPEAAIAWFDAVLDERGNETDLMNEKIAIVDIGGRTTDIAVMIPGEALAIDQAKSGTVELGVLAVLKEIRFAIAHRLSKELSVNGDVVINPDDVTMSVAETALRTGKARAWGKQHDFTNEVALSIEKIAKQIVGAVQNKLGSAMDIGQIIMIGGGANVMSGALSKYPQVHISNQPEFANARGVLKYLAFVD